MLKLFKKLLFCDKIKAGGVYMIKNNKKEIRNLNKTTITFLQQTKNGKYAPVDKELLKHTRVSITRNEYAAEEQYFYSIT